ncbi:AAA domain-containing protein [Pseudomonas sp. NPDC089734]|uniref:AAA domain-containing protein n=1 Tax=Pseudomonas sp. NPDC089734 TaxID=3364469 RepID=UPI003803624A
MTALQHTGPRLKSWKSMQNDSAAPTTKQIKYAETLAKKAGIPLPAEARSNRAMCSDFIAQCKGNTSLAPQAAAPEKPTDAQRKYVNDIASGLPDLITPRQLAEALESATASQAFISAYKAQLTEKNEEKAESKARQKLEQAIANLDIITPALRKSVAEAPSTQEKLEAVKAYKSGGKHGFTQLDATKLESINLKLMGYWLEGLKATAFDAMGGLDNLLGDKPDHSFCVDELLKRLLTVGCKDLNFERPQSPPVRHLVLKLEKIVKGKPTSWVLSVLPLEAVAQEESDVCGWTLARERVPLFNRNLLGEVSRLPGLSFDEVDDYDQWIHEQMSLKNESIEGQSPEQTLNKALKLWDKAFLILSDSNGVADWIKRFKKTQANFPALKNYKPVFALVDGGAVKGASQHVCNTYEQVLADMSVMDSPELSLFKRISQIDRPDNLLPYVPREEQALLDHLLAYVGHMDSFKNGKREAYALDPAQRDALIALENTDVGQLLAVNGPPGTGKTSLLRGVIASAWVQPLLSESNEPDCPVIIACAATNQAVTNVISSFQEAPGQPLFATDGNRLDSVAADLDSRWVPHLNSYGWFAPPSEKNEQTKRDYGHFQWITRKTHRTPWTFNGGVQSFDGMTAQQLESGYLRCARDYFDKSLSLEEVVAHLHEKVRSGHHGMVDLHRCLTQWLALLNGLEQVAPWTAQHESTRQQLRTHQQARTAEFNSCAQLQNEIDAINVRLARLEPIIDFDQPSHGYAQLLAQLPSDDALNDHSVYIRTRQTLTVAHRLSARLKELHIGSVRQWIEDKVTSIFAPGAHDRRLREIADALQACGVDVSAATPGFDEYGNLLTARIQDLQSQMQVQAAAGLSMYMSRYAVDLSMDIGQRNRWAALIEGHRSDLRHAKAGLMTQLRMLEQQHSDVDARLSELQLQWETCQAFFTQLASAREALNQSLHRLGLNLAQPSILIDSLDQVGACAQAGEPPPAAFFKKVALLLKQLQDWLDVNVRTALFHGAARYWEGRYIISRHTLAKNLEKDETWVASNIMQLREVAMLGPVFVVTAYSAPKLMRCDVRDLSTQSQPYLFGAADLLIVDEAGQGTPEIGTSAFMFAQKAIVVGDIAQLEPVWAMEKASDTRLVQRFELTAHIKAQNQVPYKALEPSGALLASGSVMRMAQKVSQWFDPDFTETPGLTLTNHYRCLSPIITICNDMVYGGDLTVATRSPAKLWRPELQRLGFLVTEEVKDTKHPAGSRRNEKEAQCIAQWIHENESSLVRHYGEPLAKVLAIVTPFKGQVPILKRALAERYGVHHNMDDEKALHNVMVIDTVHSLQGAEKQIVIFAMVDTHEPGTSHFYDKGANLINVAVSRAKEMFIVALSQNALNHGRSLKPDTLEKPSDYLWHAIATNGSRLNQRRLVLVESPHKCGAIHAALGDGIEWEIQATEGHIAQLEQPDKWDARHSSHPLWSPLSETGTRIFERLANLWPDLETIYLATDADAEGELIAWHCLRTLKERLRSAQILSATSGPEVKRVRFNNLNPQTLREAFEQAAQGLDAGLVKSALTRSLLDHLLHTQYPAKIGHGKPNATARGIGRVQLGVLDLVRQSTQTPIRYAVQVEIPMEDGRALKTFACPSSESGTSIWTTEESKAASKAQQVIEKKLRGHDGNFAMHASLGPLQQLDTYPALNTARMLALGWRAGRLWPDRVMEALQALYEGQTAISESQTNTAAPIPLEQESLQ